MMAPTTSLIALMVLLCSGCAVAQQADPHIAQGYVPLRPTGIYQHRSPCANYEILKKSLQRGGERLLVSMIAKNPTNIYEVWVDKDQNDWTLILHTSIDDEGCVVGSGLGLVLEGSPKEEASH